jgi:hypothetical protein
MMTQPILAGWDVTHHVASPLIVATGPCFV